MCYEEFTEMMREICEVNMRFTGKPAAVGRGRIPLPPHTRAIARCFARVERCCVTLSWDIKVSTHPK